MENTQINCKEACVNGCILGEKCPNIEYKNEAVKFIENTSLDQMLDMAERARMKKMTEPPKWVFPEEL